VQGREIINSLIKDEERTQLASGRDFFVTRDKGSSKLSLIIFGHARVIELFTTSHPEMICSGLLWKTGGWVRHMLIDEIRVASIPAGTEESSSHTPDVGKILGG